MTNQTEVAWKGHAFGNEKGNLVGIFFQTSLIPYLMFLHFISYKSNNTPKISIFGFQFLLMFVFATIPCGIVCKTAYGMSLADVDWLHGGAETLLTVTNLLVAYGFKSALSSGDFMAQPRILKHAALIAAAVVAATAATGYSVFGLEAHTPFLAGIGEIGEEMMSELGLAKEPENALSIPTWTIHLSSVLEYMYIINLVWQYGEFTRNRAWRWLSFGMLPILASAVAACTNHFFFNSPQLSFLVVVQAAMTCLGNITTMLAALRIALSNGWQLSDLNPLQQGAPAHPAPPVPPAVPSSCSQERGSGAAGMLAGLAFLTVASAYLVKYGELALSLPFQPDVAAASAMVAAPPSLLALYFGLKALQDPYPDAHRHATKPKAA